MDTIEVSWTKEGQLGVIRLPSRPWGRRAVLELDSIIGEVAEDDSLRALILEGGRPDFCSGPGSDLDALGAGVDPAARLAALTVPAVAVLRGQCRSPGLILALAADIRLVAPDARLSLSDVTDGRFPLWGGIQRLTRVIGPARAGPMVLLGSEVPASDATRLGLAHELAEDPTPRARELATVLATRGPLALEYAKEAIWRGAELPIHHALRLEADFNHLLQASEDRAEGLAAFFDKREPRFRGR